jgi:hypothetical protein
MSSIFGFQKSNAKIQNGNIVNTNIDMSNKVITNHAVPTNNGDVVNKLYCDANSNNVIPSFNISLSGTLWTTDVFVAQEGVYRITIKNGMSGGPCASFELAKNHPSRGASIIRNTSGAGISTEERLEIRWLPNSGIDVRKTGSNYDGTYTVTYIDQI